MRALPLLLMCSCGIGVDAAAQTGDPATPPDDEARIKVELVGVEGELAQNILAHLDLVRLAGRDDLPERTVRQVFDAAPAQVRLALRPLGYYNPEIDSSLVPQDDRFVARIEIEPGRRAVLEEVDVRVLGPGSGDERFAHVLAQSRLAPGLAVHHGDYDSVRAQLERTARSLGYFDHRYLHRGLVVDPQTETADAQLVLDTGERYRFGVVHFEQEILAPEIVDRLVSVREGEPYDGDRLIATQYALADSGYFANVFVQAGERDPQTRTAAVSIQAEPAPRQRLSYGVGYGTDTQLRLRGGWDVDRLNRRGHRTTLDLRISEPLVDAVAHYIIPIADPLTDRFAVRAAYVEEDLADLVSSRKAFGVLHQRLLNGGWQRNLFVDAVRERTRLPGAGPTLVGTQIVPGFAVEHLEFDDPVLPSEGYRLYGELRASHAWLGADADFLRAHFAGSRLTPLGEDWSVLWHGAVGFGWVKGFDRLPGSQRFFAGGDESVRGYRYRALGAADREGNRVGGRHLLTGSAELRRALGDWVQVAGFVDAGNAPRQLGEAVEVALGVGVHVITPLGRLRAEIARSVTENRSFRLHLSIRPDL